MFLSIIANVKQSTNGLTETKYKAEQDQCVQHFGCAYVWLLQLLLLK